MSIIADRLRARIDAMKSRHAGEMAEINKAREETEKALRTLIESTDRLLDEF